MPSQIITATRREYLPDITNPISIATSSRSLGHDDDDCKMMFPRQSSTMDTLDSDFATDSTAFSKNSNTGCLSFSSSSQIFDSAYNYNPRSIYNYTMLPKRSMSLHKDGIYRDDADANNILVGPPMGRTDIVECFEYLLKRSDPDMPCLGIRQENGVFTYMSRSEFQTEYLHLAEGFRTHLDELFPLTRFDDIGLRVGGSQVCEYSTIPEDIADFRILGIATKNIYEFPLLEYASQLLGITMVPLYNTLGEKAMAVVFEETKMNTIILDLPSAEIFLNSWDVMNDIDHLPTNVILTHDQRTAEWNKNKGSLILQRLQNLNRKVTFLNDYQAQTPIEDQYRYKWHPEKIWTISYTSGTTGRPKGAMLSQRTFMTVTFDVLSTYCIDEGLNNTGEYFPTYFSYLPLAHILERASLNAMMTSGLKICFHSGDITTLFDEIRDAGTTVMPSVPRVLERMHMKIMDVMKSKSFVVRKLFNQGKKSKIELRKGTTKVRHKVWDRVIMDKIKALTVGPQLKTIICGGAPLATELKKDIEAFLSVEICNGYGLTESGGASFVQHSRDTDNCVGWIMKSNEAKLVDVPELERYCKDGAGELMIRGYGIFSGYFRQAERTQEVMTEDGWFRTGDVATYSEKTGFSIVDRVKNCFKLAQGEYIAPERIENILKSCFQVDQAIVTGDSSKTFSIAFLSLTDGAIGSKKAIDLISDSEYRDSTTKEIQANCRELGLNGFEIPKVFVFMSRTLMPDDSFHTPTLKLKRPVFDKRFNLIMQHAYKMNTHFGLDIDRFMNYSNLTPENMDKLLK